MEETARFRRIEELFHAASELPPEAREPFLHDACSEDAELYRDVARLLALDARETCELEDRLSAPAGSLPPTLTPGQRLDAYEIVELIGEGGMGEVYRAQQWKPFRRDVALKLVKAGMDTRQVLERFENERQALAVMNHPGIAHVLDAGATPEGRLYFAMELVRGVSITEFCDDRRLTVPERLELFQRVCHAVQHAHQKGVIHRDLKPSNILVEVADGRFQPKIIDFGIAKVVAAGPDQAPGTTRVGQSVGTPEYMSPEQADPGAPVDTRTDVYSLGLVLHVLLTGHHPFDVASLRRLGPSEVRSYLRDTEPERPSTSASRSDEAAAARRCNPPSLQRCLAGDLDWIVARALEKNPDRRYASASELAADVGRHLRNEPVLAGPPGRAYRFRKFVRRHRGPVTVAGLTMALLLASIGAITTALLKARQAEEAAVRQATVANEVTDLLAGVLATEDPFREGAGEQTVRDVVDLAAERIDSGGVRDPEVYARLSAALASVMVNQGLHEEALELTRRALGRLEASGSPLGGHQLELLYQQSRAESQLGRYQEARRTADRLVTRAEQLLPPDSARLAVYFKQRGDAEDVPGGTHAAQEHWHRLAMATLRKAPDASPEELGSVLHALAGSTSDAVECAELAEEELELWRQHLGAEHPRVAEARYALGRCARLTGDVEAAAQHYTEAYELRLRALGPDHPLTFRSTFQLHDALYELGRFEEAQQLTEKSLHVARDADLQATIAVLLNQSFTYLPYTADFEVYDERLARSVSLFRQVYEGETDWSLMARHTRADGLANAGRLAEAREHYLTVLELREQLAMPRNYYQALLLDNLSTVERRLGLLEEAQRHLDEAIALYPSSIFDPRYHARAWVSKATLLWAQGKREPAEDAFRRASVLYADCAGQKTFQDLRYETAWRALREERAAVIELLQTLRNMGVHPDFLLNEPELLALFGEQALRRLLGGAVDS